MRFLLCFIVAILFQIDGIAQDNNEKKAIDKVFSLPEVKARSVYIDSVTNNKKGISIIVLKHPSKKNNYYWIQAGYSGPDRFIPHFNFYVYLPNLEVKYYDTMEDEVLTLAEWRSRMKE